MSKSHKYQTTVNWTGANEVGTRSYVSYERSYDIEIENKPTIQGSSDPSFRGDNGKHNPEELLVASISSCHMLWYLHLCSVQKIVVLEYADRAEGTMTEDGNGSGKFEKVVLRPSIKIEDSSKRELADSLHEEAHKKCFIANSVNFDVICEPVFVD